VLPTGYSCALPAPPKGALAMALHALNLAINQRLAADIASFEGVIDLHVIPQPCPLSVSPVDFSRSAELIGRSYASARKWLAAPRPETGQAALLAPHRH
jgi:NTE family protein